MIEYDLTETIEIQDNSQKMVDRVTCPIVCELSTEM